MTAPTPALPRSLPPDGAAPAAAERRGGGRPPSARIAAATFAAATLGPLVLLAGGALWGGVWALAGFLWVAVFAVLGDRVIPPAPAEVPGQAEFPAAQALLVTIGVAAPVLLLLAVRAVAGGSGLGAGEAAALLAGVGLWLGQVAHPAAHELIHSRARGPFRLGVAVYSTLAFGHHASAHRLVHHPRVATRADPSTARAGEGFWRYLPRAWAGAFREGLAAETARRRAAGRGGLHPYAVYAAGAAATAAAALAIGGGRGLAVWAVLAAHAQLQILLGDYVQHYGLVRKPGADGRPGPVTPAHAWNSPHRASGAMMLNATRHSDHHLHPDRPYPALRLPGPEVAPRLPWPMPVACAVALVPPLWRRAMAPHLARWSGG